MTEELPAVAEQLPIRHIAKCTRCSAQLLLDQHPDCPRLNVDAWLKIIVCNRCGAYLEAYRKLDNAIAYVCGQMMLARNSPSYGQVRSVCDEKITKLTQDMERLFMKRWNTLNAWGREVVEIIMEQPDKSRVAVRIQEGAHRRARQKADRDDQLKKAVE